MCTYLISFLHIALRCRISLMRENDLNSTYVCMYKSTRTWPQDNRNNAGILNKILAIIILEVLDKRR